jgi:uncharacterized membrane protein required for colicin V production
VILSFFLLVLLFGFVLFGLWFGFIHALGSLLGTVVGALIAGRLYEPIASWISSATSWDANVLRVVCFLVIFVVVNRTLGLLLYVVERIFRFLSIIPFVRTIDRLLGGILGFLEGVFVLGLTLYVASRIVTGPLAAAIPGSSVASWLMQTAGVLVPLLPAIVRQGAA